MNSPSSPVSRQQTLVSRQQTVRVDFDPKVPSLVVSPTEVDVRAGDVLIWQFFGLKRQWFPWIRFQLESLGESGTGPLEGFSQSSDAIWGTVRQDAAGTFVYRASARVLEGLLKEEVAALVSSSEARFRVHDSSSQSLEPFQTIVVDIDLQDGWLVVPPNQRNIPIVGGQSIQWRFPARVFGEPTGAVLPRVQFLAYGSSEDVAEGIDLRLGPFTTMTFGELTVTATGYAQKVPGVYNYRLLAVRQSDGEIVWASSPDPLVDDRGEPPGSPSA